MEYEELLGKVSEIVDKLKCIKCKHPKPEYADYILVKASAIDYNERFVIVFNFVNRQGSIFSVEVVSKYKNNEITNVDYKKHYFESCKLGMGSHNRDRMIGESEKLFAQLIGLELNKEEIEKTIKRYY